MRRVPGIASVAVVTLIGLAVVASHDLRPVETLPDRAARTALDQGGEVLHMRWRISGILGALAGLFIPNSGDALITSVSTADDLRDVEFLITAPGRDDDYFFYGASINEKTGTTVAVRSAQAFRGDHDGKELAVDDPQVMDFASAIYHLRWNPPVETTTMIVWDDGRYYAAEIVPLRQRTRKIDGEKVAVRGYAVRGARVDGKESFRDKITIYFARDARSTPVEIIGKRGWVRVRIRLVEAGGIPRNVAG